MPLPDSHLRRVAPAALLLLLGFAPVAAQPAYVNFESSHVHPIDLTPSGVRLLVVNTPDATLEVFDVGAGGALAHRASIPVGLEPVTVAARTDSEAWVVNHLSDTVSIVDLAAGIVVRTLAVGDEPTDVAFAAGRAFVAVSQEDAVKVYALADLAAPPAIVPIFGRRVRALAASPDGAKVYAVPLHSGNQTTVVNANIIAGNASGLNATRLADLGLNDMTCDGAPPPYPPLPAGVQRNPALTDPAPPAQPPVSLIVKWDRAAGRFKDEAGQDWTRCLPFRLPDRDLFVIDAATLAVTSVPHLGTTLFEVAVNPGNGRVYVPHTDARNIVRFEHPLGVRGHAVDNRLAIVDPAAGNAVTLVDLNAHIDRGSDPATNLLERTASVSQPGMLVWNAAGTRGYLTAIGSRKVFRVDGACAAPGCVFGADRAVPDAVETGEGPTGVALHEGHGRLYVVNRFTNSLAVVDAAAMRKVGEIALHDPGPESLRRGRRFLYDAIDTSGHGDQACSSCHVSGDRDDLAWDLGDPAGAFAPYGTPGDNVRFIIPLFNQPVECQPSVCAAHDGFDPQKGPMATQTLRGMLEPLHWRGDRPTLRAFNKAFVGLLGKQDIGPVDGEPAGLTAEEIDLFRRFALDIVFPPNPHRRVDDTLPNAVVSLPGQRLSGNPQSGQNLFATHPSDAGQPCTACHAFPFGAAGGRIGGVEPGDPSAARTALFNGNADGSPHSDLEVPHLRNMYEKIGPRFGSHTNAADPPADQKSGFGFVHDGSIPDMATFLSAGVFNLNAGQVRDIATFMMHFPTGTRPAVGRNLTLPPGTPPTGAPAQEALLSSLIALGNLASAGRHCDLVASAPGAGRPRTWVLDGGAAIGGLWRTDVTGEPQVTTQTLRASAAGPVTFLCGTIGSGVRLGIDRDLDARLNGEDCADGDAASWGAPAEVTGVAAAGTAPDLAWDGQAALTGPGVVYDVAGGLLADLRVSGPSAASCLASGLAAPGWSDGRGDPAPGAGRFYLVRARNTCGSGGYGAGLETLDSLACASP
jgi:DNA-binding beta-propeller fold protein YncE